jgi:hypothetical protein
MHLLRVAALILILKILIVYDLVLSLAPHFNYSEFMFKFLGLSFLYSFYFSLQPRILIAVFSILQPFQQQLKREI